MTIIGNPSPGSFWRLTDASSKCHSMRPGMILEFQWALGLYDQAGHADVGYMVREYTPRKSVRPSFIISREVFFEWCTAYVLTDEDRKG